VTGSPDPAAPGKTVALRAKITPRAGAAGDPGPVTGTVTFKTGSTKLCSGEAVNSSGVATCQTSKLPAGNTPVTAAFASTSPYLDSSDRTELIVGTVPTFGNADHATVKIGKHATITVHASATPTATITKLRGKLPKGMKFSSGKGSATIAATPARGTAKTYVLHLRARNVRASTTEAFTLKVVAA
jgi:hypothetical protein